MFAELDKMTLSDTKVKEISKLFANLQILATGESRVRHLHSQFLGSSLFTAFPSQITWDGSPSDFVNGLKQKAKSKNIEVHSLFQFVFEAIADAPNNHDEQIFEEIQKLIY
jgi:hypothetical protein